MVGLSSREHSIPREEAKGGRKTRFSPTITTVVFDLSHAVIHNLKKINAVSDLPFTFLLVL